MKKLQVLGFISTLRSRITSKLFYSVLQQADTYERIIQIIYKLGCDQKIANSEALLLAAMFGAKEAGAECSLIKLKDYFSLVDDQSTKSKDLIDLIKDANGFILSTPVYFGDRSSFLADLIKILKKSQKDTLPLNNKAVGIVSVGAKRNGGQETTNIYALWECLELGACIVGNGPPTSQYGGTGWAGNVGAIIDDNFGFMTSKGTGRRVALLSHTLNLVRKPKNVRILFLVTRSDNNEIFIKTIKNLPFSSNVILDVLDITKMKIKRCHACSICPKENLGSNSYGCIIKDDDMQLIYNYLIQADCIVLAHYQGPNAGPDKFQIFMERTRFIRRNNFELANWAFSYFGFTNSFTDIFPLRVMTSFLRHNLFIIGPFYVRYIDKDNFYSETIPLELYIQRLESFTYKTKFFREKEIDNHLQYIPVGY